MDELDALKARLAELCPRSDLMDALVSPRPCVYMYVCIYMYTHTYMYWLYINIYIHTYMHVKYFTCMNV